MTGPTRDTLRSCDDDQHQWTQPDEFAIVLCRRCKLTLRQSFAATERQIAQLPVTPGPLGS